MPTRPTPKPKPRPGARPKVDCSKVREQTDGLRKHGPEFNYLADMVCTLMGCEPTPTPQPEKPAA